MSATRRWLLLMLALCIMPSYASAQCDCNSPLILYAPTHDDDASWRAVLEQQLNAQVDYFDARATTPNLAFLAQYCSVITWVNDPYEDNVLMGDILADYVDQGGQVILGALSFFTMGNALSGRIMNPGYSPVTAPDGATSGQISDYSLDGSDILFNGVQSLTSFTQDTLVMQGDGILDGTFDNGLILGAYRPDFGVVYLNGMTSPNFLANSQTGDWDILINNAFRNNCPVVIPTLSDWVMINLFLAMWIIVIRAFSSVRRVAI